MAKGLLTCHRLYSCGVIVVKGRRFTVFRNMKDMRPVTVTNCSSWLSVAEAPKACQVLFLRILAEYDAELLFSMTE
jgi:hypothetical protein